MEVGVRGGLPPAQILRRAVAEVVKTRPPQRLEEIQLPGQGLFQHRARIAPRRRAQTEVLILQHGVQQGVGPVGAPDKQYGLEGGHGAAQVTFLGGQGRPQRTQQRGVQQIAEHHQRIQACQPFHTLHI